MLVIPTELSTYLFTYLPMDLCSALLCQIFIYLLKNEAQQFQIYFFRISIVEN